MKNGVLTNIRQRNEMPPTIEELMQPAMHAQVGDEREEGEIIDEYEDILSSDDNEVIIVRKRIQELEAENAEREQIDTISSQHNYAPPSYGSLSYPRKKKLATEILSAASSEELLSSKKKRRKHKSNRERDKEHFYKSRRRRNPANSKWRRAHRERHFSDEELETISLDSFKDDSRDSISRLSREELRLALGRPTKEHIQIGSLKERLQKENCHISNSPNENDITEEKLKDEDTDDSMSLEESELRLIALKSAVMRKHFARKKRNAEIAYSPTDFVDLTGNANSNETSDAVDVDVDLTGIQTGMDLSPATSPPSALSPKRQEEHSEDETPQPVDMDIANSDSDVDLSYKWTPLEQIPLPTEVLNMPDVNLSARFDAAPLAYGMYMPEIYELPHTFSGAMSVEQDEPMPQVEFRIDAKTKDERTFSNGNPETSHDFRFNEDNSNDFRSMHEDNSNSNMYTDKPSGSRAGSRTGSAQEMHAAVQPAEDSTDDEALREFLLANLPTERQSKAAQIASPITTEDTEDLDELRSMLLSSLPQKKEPECILKKAVRRLKMTPKPEEPTRQRRYSERGRTRRRRNSYAKSKQFTAPEELQEEADDNSNDVGQRLAHSLHDRRHHGAAMCAKENTSSNHSLDVDAVMLDQIFMYELQKQSQLFPPSFEAAPNRLIWQPPEVQYDRGHITPHFQTEMKEKPPGTETPSPAKDNLTEVTTQVSPERAPSPPKLPAKLPRLDIPSNTTLRPVHKIIKTPLKKPTPPAATVARKPLSPAKPTSTASKNILKPAVTKKTLPNLLHTTARLPLKKIVKPNKVINTNVNLNPKTLKLIKETAAENDAMRAATKLANANTARLITSVEKAKIQVQVKSLIINLQHSDSESNEELEAEEDVPCNAGAPNSTTEPLLLAKLQDYDNYSPMSLCMASPCSPATEKGACDKPPAMDVQQQAEQSKLFEQKLDSFLNDVRSKIQQKHAAVVPQAVSSSKLAAPSLSTPTAVRHLPAASQQEYRRLVHRIKLLESQKLSKLNGGNPATKEVAPKKNGLTVKAEIDEAVAKEKTGESGAQDSCPQQLNVYESAFAKTSTNIMTTLNKTLKLVEEAKCTKISKLRHEKRLEELHREMQEVELKVKRDQRKMAEMLPNITTLYGELATQKQRRNKLFKAVTEIGKKQNGAEYSLKNELKQEISVKTNKLAVEIKIFNSLKYRDIEGVEEVHARTNETKNSSCSKQTQVDVEELMEYSAAPRPKDIEKLPNASEANELENECLQNVQQPVEKMEDEDPTNAVRYDSPLESPCQKDNCSPNVNGVLCPYELLGCCEDADCGYVHTRAKKTVR